MTRAGAGATVVGAVVLLGLCAGCSVSRSDDGWTFSAFQLAPGDEIQATTMTTVGLAVLPAEGRILLGYTRMQAHRIPGFEEPTQVPDVSISTSVDGSGAIVQERLDVDD